MTMNDGRNNFPKPNSDSKCLLDNWFEERATKHIDKGTRHIKQAHNGILSITNAPPNYESVMHADYKGLPLEEQLYMGQKQYELELSLYEKIRQEIQNEIEMQPEKSDFKSVTKLDFHYHNPPTRCPPKDRPCNMVREQPVSYWTEYRDRIHGLSQVKAKDTPFRKNTSFSTPIGEFWDGTQPYELENYPKM